MSRWYKTAARNVKNRTDKAPVPADSLIPEQSDCHAYESIFLTTPCRGRDPVIEKIPAPMPKGVSEALSALNVMKMIPARPNAKAAMRRQDISSLRISHEKKLVAIGLAEIRMAAVEALACLMHRA